MTKKGIQLTLNFLVTIIIAVVVFSFGVKFVYNLVSEVSELETLTYDNLNERIGDILCEGADKVCIGVNRKVIPRGKFDVFGIKIINVVDVEDFNIIIDRSRSKRITNNQEFSVTANEIDLKFRNTFKIKKNEEENIGIGIEVKKEAPSGIYIFDVWVSYDDGRIIDYGNNKWVGNLADDEKTAYKIYVEVP